MEEKVSKENEKILVIDDKHLRHFLPEGVSLEFVHYNWLLEKLPLAYFMKRGTAEKDETIRQVIPYIVFQRETENFITQLFTYQRTKKTGEKRLALQYSIGIGGHINPVDIDNKGPLYSAAQREIQEELKLGCGPYIPATPVEGVIYDNSNPVGRVHVGVLMIAKIGDWNLEPKEDHLANGEWCNITALAEGDYNLDLENWTKLALKAMMNKQRERREYLKKYGLKD